MEDDVRHFVLKVCRCVKGKKPHIRPVAPRQSIPSSASLELIGVVFLHFDTCSGGYQYFLIPKDPFSHFFRVYRTTNKSAKTVADCLYNYFISIHEIPAKILHSQGKEFENNLFAQLSKRYQRKHSKTTLYYPQTNQQTKRINQTKISMLRTLPDQHSGETILIN